MFVQKLDYCEFQDRAENGEEEEKKNWLVSFLPEFSSHSMEFRKNKRSDDMLCQH